MGRPGKRWRGRPRGDRQVALFARFYADLFELMIQWAALAETEIQAWPRTDGLGMTECTHALREELVSRSTAGHGAKDRPSAQQAGSHPPGRAVT